MISYSSVPSNRHLRHVDSVPTLQCEVRRFQNPVFNERLKMISSPESAGYQKKLSPEPEYDRYQSHTEISFIRIIRDFRLLSQTCFNIFSICPGKANPSDWIVCSNRSYCHNDINQPFPELSSIAFSSALKLLFTGLRIGFWKLSTFFVIRTSDHTQPIVRRFSPGSIDNTEVPVGKIGDLRW